MSSLNAPAGAILTIPETHTVMPCEGNFSLSRIEMKLGEKITEHVFDPPYKLRDGEAYAIYQAPTGGVELWQVEYVQRGAWRWKQEAKRAKAKRLLTLATVDGERIC